MGFHHLSPPLVYFAKRFGSLCQRFGIDLGVGVGSVVVKQLFVDSGGHGGATGAGSGWSEGLQLGCKGLYKAVAGVLRVQGIDGLNYVLGGE